MVMKQQKETTQIQTTSYLKKDLRRLGIAATINVLILAALYFNLHEPIRALLP